MRKPFQTDSVASKQPNEPRMYPGQQDFNKSSGGSNLEGFAESAPIKAEQQTAHIAVPIGSEHVFGGKLAEPKGLHSDTKMPSAAKMPKFADKEKMPKLGSGLKIPKA
jgi:hypothetical protein